jgi:putative restriction endonuclease
MSFYTRGNGEIAVALSPDLLVEYVANQAALHGYGDVPGEIEILEAAARGMRLPEETISQLPETRRATVNMVSRLARESSFRIRVLRAYRHSCAACSLQLGLVQAAHIVPVATPGSTDETGNGLALCALHHLGYDSGILGVYPDYSIAISQRRLAHFLSIGQGEGREKFAAVHAQILVPHQQKDRPRPEYLKRGLEVRGFAA